MTDRIPEPVLSFADGSTVVRALCDATRCAACGAGCWHRYTLIAPAHTTRLGACRSIRCAERRARVAQEASPA